MKYRTLGRTGLRVSALGFGAMRLPTLGQDAEIDEPVAIGMLREAIELGVNYVDTAYVYHGGQSEVVLGKALADGYRQRVRLATKLPVWPVHELADCERLLAEQFQRLRTDHLDVYLLHCLQKHSWRKMRELGVLDWARRAQAAGRIGRIGFSFHDSYEVLVEIVDAFEWDCCQIQYNYMNENVQAGTRGLKYAAGAGLAVIIMEPLFGGTLVHPPPSVQAVWDAAQPPADPLELAFRWLWDKPEVALVLSGMSAPEQVRQNAAVAERAVVGGLQRAELELLARVRQAYEKLAAIPCTKCGYCLPCPHGVNIPFNFELANSARVFGGSTVALSRNLYHGQAAGESAAACLECGDCLDKCPQKIPIAATLAQVRQQFE